MKIPQRFISLLILLGLFLEGSCFAEITSHELQRSNIYGLWTRVFSSCDRVPMSKLTELRHGVSNENWRKMNIYIDENQYEITNFDSAKCRHAGSCSLSGVNQGSIDFSNNSNQMKLTLTYSDITNHSNNLWGVTYRDFEYQVVQEDILILKAHSAGCGDKKASVVLIRPQLF